MASETKASSTLGESSSKVKPHPSEEFRLQNTELLSLQIQCTLQLYIYGRISVGVKADGTIELLVHFLYKLLSHYQKLYTMPRPYLSLI